MHAMDTFDLVPFRPKAFNSSFQIEHGILHEPGVAIQGRHVRFEDRFPEDGGTRECGVRACRVKNQPFEGRGV